ncbi:MAG: hypothetical protein AB1921_15295 [Thermodesulfobacteriota bacterium]
MKKIVLAMGLAFLMLFSTAAFAADWKAADTNSDGKVTKEEALAAGITEEDFMAVATPEGVVIVVAEEAPAPAPAAVEQAPAAPAAEKAAPAAEPKKETKKSKKSGKKKAAQQ